MAGLLDGWPQRPMGVLGSADAFGNYTPTKRQMGLLEKLGMTWPARMVQSAMGAATLPGDVYAGRVNPNSDEAVGRAADLAGMLTLGASAVPAEANSLNMGIRAYHGSPHDFNQFDMSKIGTGEGAQAYGHGLYMAENPAVAADYAKRLSTDSALVRDRNALALQLGKASSDGERVSLQSQIDGLTQKIAASQKGHRYEVSINAHPDEFLNWDAPLSEQSQKVQDALKNAAASMDASTAEGSYLASVLRRPDKFSGRDLASGTLSNETVSNLGIKGIKYKDAGSRGTDTGTHNYVVFDDKIIDILKKYGIAGLTAGGAGMGILGTGKAEAAQ